MEQRPLRLGDILDDYCPRERRVTNHAIVAMIEEKVQQTRCVTCDFEHPYKGGKPPRRRVKKESTAALYKEVLAGMPDAEGAPTPVAPGAMADKADPDPPVGGDDRAMHPAALDGQGGVTERVGTEVACAASADEPAPSIIEEGPVHRPLIRATLPRPEGHKETRPIPDFTMRQPLGRGRFRGDGRMPSRGGAASTGHGPNGNRSTGGSRFGGPRPSGRRKRSR